MNDSKSQNYSGTKVTLLASSLLLLSCGQEEERATLESSPRLTPVEVVEVQFEEGYPASQSFVAAIEARRESQLGFELSGTLETLGFEEGDQVSAGSSLATLDRTRLLARMKEIEASISENDANLVFAESVVQRNQKLIESRAVSREDFEDSQQQLDLTRARKAQLLAQKESVQIDLNKSEILAPYSGTISRRLLDEGAIVTVNQPVFQLLETGALELRAALSDQVASQVARAGEAKIQFPDGSEEVLTVSRVLPDTDRQTRTVDLIFAVPEEKNRLRDGDLATLVFEAQVEASGFWLPRSALTESERGLWACYVALPEPESGEGAHRLDLRNLQILHYRDDRVFASGTIRDNELIVANGLQKLAQGQRVRLLP